MKQIEIYEKKDMIVEDNLYYLKIRSLSKMDHIFTEEELTESLNVKTETYPIRAINWFSENKEQKKLYVICDDKINEFIDNMKNEDIKKEYKKVNKDNMILRDMMKDFLNMNFWKRLRFLLKIGKVCKEIEDLKKL